MTRLLSLAIAIPVAAYLMYQVRKPSGWLGRVVVRNMNLRHSSLTDWGLGHVQVGDQGAILDVGCGGGRTLAKLAALAPGARLVGIDYSAASVAESRAHNAGLIAAGRMEVTAASVERIPGPAAQFDLVTAVETHYYWPNLVRSLAEVRRVLKPGGVLVIIAEVYRNAWTGWVTALAMAPLRAAVLTADEHRRRLEAAGYEAINVTTDAKRGWICAVARAPA